MDDATQAALAGLAGAPPNLPVEDQAAHVSAFTSGLQELVQLLPSLRVLIDQVEGAEARLHRFIVDEVAAVHGAP